MASEAVPHGGSLINTMITENSLKNDAISACNFAVELDERQLCDVELLMQGNIRMSYDVELLIQAFKSFHTI